MKIEINHAQAAALQLENRNERLKSNLGFIKQHHGFRKGMIHALIGTTGGGKTTLRNSLIVDFVSNNPKKNIFIWQSEESTEDLMTKLSRNNEVINSKNIFCVSEPDLVGEKSSKEIQKMFFEEPINCEADLVIFDNLTTSSLYGHRPNEQADFAAKLKVQAKETGIPHLLLLHTAKGIGMNHKGFISSSDVRGSASVVNLAEYSYNLQQFHIGTSIVTTVICEKSRHHTKEHVYFQVTFNSERQLYDKCVPLSFEDMKNLYKHRNTLGGV